jgi:Leucine-rich repeat (LRR) protein
MGSNLSKKAQERIQTAKKNKSNEINLSDCQLKKLPHVVRTSLKNLTILRLSHNYLTFLPPSIANFVDLEEFYVDTNELTNLPKELFTLIKIRVLNIAHNQITTLPGSSLFLFEPAL